MYGLLTQVNPQLKDLQRCLSVVTSEWETNETQNNRILLRDLDIHGKRYSLRSFKYCVVDPRGREECLADEGTFSFSRQVAINSEGLTSLEDTCQIFNSSGGPILLNLSGDCGVFVTDAFYELAPHYSDD